jgi:hypothetical protein
VRSTKARNLKCTLIHVRWPPSFLPVLEFPFGYIRTGTPFSEVFPERFAVVAFVGIEFGYSTLCSHPELLHSSFSTDNVIPVALGGHVSQWQTILFSQQ